MDSFRMKCSQNIQFLSIPVQVKHFCTVKHSIPVQCTHDRCQGTVFQYIFWQYLLDRLVFAGH